MNRAKLEGWRDAMYARDWNRLDVGAPELAQILDALLEAGDAEGRAFVAQQEGRSAIGAAMARDWRGVQTEIEAWQARKLVENWSA